MQPLVHDPYTADEIRAVLHGERKVTFEYDLLDEANAKIKTLEKVEAASVKHDAKAEIKRTARFTLAEGEAIDFGSKRIRPLYVLAMPTLITDLDDDQRDFAAGTHDGTTATSSGLQLDLS